MTNYEKAVVMAYTDVVMLDGDNFEIFHRYAEEKLGRPVQIYEFADKAFMEQLKNAAKEDFEKLCDEEENSKVYVITDGDYSDYHICAVAKTREKAEYLQKLFSRSYHYDSPTIEEYDADKYEMTNLLRVFMVMIYEDGRFDLSWRYESRETFEQVFRLHDDNSFYAEVAAKDHNHALKIAFDTRVKMIAEKIDI